MESRADRVVYKIVKFFYKVLGRMARKMNRAAHELNFLMYKIEFGERDDDIYIYAYPKSGITLMQMIIYQLTTDGNIDFEHIYDVSPWIRNDAYENIEPRKLKSPRIIKSHDAYSDFDPHTKGRFIYVFRDGKDIAISKYHQNKNYNNPDLKFDDFLKDFFKPGKFNWFTYHKRWLRNKKRAPILYVRYEDMLNHFDQVVQVLIKFLKLDPAKIDFNRVKERTRFDFMKQYESKFGNQPPKKEKIYDQFFRKGKIGEGKKRLSKEQIKEYDMLYKKHIYNLEKKFVI